MLVICPLQGSNSTSIADKQVEWSVGSRLIADGDWRATADNRELSAIPKGMAWESGEIRS